MICSGEQEWPASFPIESPLIRCCSGTCSFQMIRDKLWVENSSKERLHKKSSSKEILLELRLRRRLKGSTRPHQGHVERHRKALRFFLRLNCHQREREREIPNNFVIILIKQITGSRCLTPRTQHIELIVNDTNFFFVKKEC